MSYFKERGPSIDSKVQKNIDYLEKLSKLMEKIYEDNDDDDDRPKKLVLVNGKSSKHN
jgi:hypothetical protein